jgi:putative CRISPR-associated protein (TIGR02619 family)
MKNSLFVTVGVSALEGPRRILRTNPSRKGDLEPLAQEVEEFRRDKRPAKTGNALYEPLLAFHLGVWRHVKFPEEHTDRGHQTSAELVTTAALLRQLAQDTNVVADRIVLLVPDTPEGLLSGRIVKAVMEAQEYRAHCPVPEVRTHTIPGIAEAEAVKRLPDALLCAVEENRECESDRVIFNATAGYGATLVLIGMLALRYGYRIYYQHESMKSPIFISQSLSIGWSPRTWILS